MNLTTVINPDLIVFIEIKHAGGKRAIIHTRNHETTVPNLSEELTEVDVLAEVRRLWEPKPKTL